MIERLDHVNVRTAKLNEMIAWYGSVLDMHPGARPNFGFDGAWLYAKGVALVHLVDVETEPADSGKDLKLEHAAFSATGLTAFQKKLDEMGEPYELAEVADAGIMQVNVWDPDGNHLHIDFALSEVTAA